MRSTPTIRLCTLALGLAIAVGTPSKSDALTVANNAKIVYKASDSNANIKVTLNPLQVTKISTAAQLADLTTALTKSNAAKNGWGNNLTFNTGNDIGGTLTVDVYKAALKTATTGGAQFLARYSLPTGSKVPVNQLYWLQVVKTTAPNGGEAGAYPDVYFTQYKGFNGNAGGYTSPVAGTKALPFYFTPAETTLDNNPYTANGTKIYSDKYTFTGSDGKAQNASYDMSFWDYPSRGATNSWTGDLYLAQWAGGNNKNITVYNGVEWGFDVTKVAPAPEASSMIAFALLMGLGAFGLIRKRSTGNAV